MEDKGCGADGDDDEPIVTERVLHTQTGEINTTQSSKDQLASSQTSKGDIRQHKQLIVKMLKKRSVYRTAPV